MEIKWESNSGEDVRWFMFSRFVPIEEMWHLLYSEQVSKFLSMHWGCRMWNFVTFYWVVDHSRLTTRIQVWKL